MNRKLKQLILVLTLTLTSTSIATELTAEQKAKVTEIDCLAKNIFYESYAEPHQGKRAVAYVTINRVVDPKYPNSICGVVKQANQFEWVRAGKWKVKNKQAYKDSLMVAFSVYVNYDKAKDPTNGATMFHANYIKPKWNWRKLTKTVKIGNHIFYKELS